MSKNLQEMRLNSIKATENGIPNRTSNQFFGVGPITDMTLDEVDARKLKIEFDHFLEANYPKLNDQGEQIGNYTAAELNRGMHRGYPADKVLQDMMHHICRYFEIPKSSKVAVGLGGGHSGFTVAALHMINGKNNSQNIFIDTPRPETDIAKKSGFFRQSWGAQITELLRNSKDGDEDRLHFASDEGNIPSADRLKEMGIKLFFGVGHETTGATTYTEDEIKNLLAWIDMDPENHHAVIDATSLLGAMPWAKDTISQMMSKCCMFTPFQKAIGGVSGYFIFSITPAAEKMIDENVSELSWSIPRQLKIAMPEDMKMPLSSKHRLALGPIFDVEQDKMLGGIINTFSTLAFAETTFAILRNEKNIGDVHELNKRSKERREIVSNWIAEHDIFNLGVENNDSRGTAVTLIKVTDPDIEDRTMLDNIIAESKKLLGFEGLTHPNGEHEKGLDVARYINAFPGTDGDYRAWVGGIRPIDDVNALLENLSYAYHRAKIIVIERELAKDGITFEAAQNEAVSSSAAETHHVLVADLVGINFDKNGEADYSEVKAHIEANGGEFHLGLKEADDNNGKINFYYSPNLSREDELLAATGEGQYDALIAAATFIPKAAQFKLGGVRIGAGTGNMGADCWGGGDGAGGHAALMNTPSFNSRTTAQATFKAILDVFPNLDVDVMHQKVVDGTFDTGLHLKDYPSSKIESKTIAVLGYGNIGREVAKLAQAFGMRVKIYAREAHKAWIQSEGFEYASSIMEAAKDADIISPHLGLGAMQSDGTTANQHVINASVFAQMNDGAMLVNYDRGELVCPTGLNDALNAGKIAKAYIDADIFVNDGDVTGPMKPYLDIYPNHKDKMQLLPHAAADTEHFSRVEGAKQAVDQIFALIQDRMVVNLKGELPEGFSNGGACTVNNVGKVTKADISKLSQDDLVEMRKLTEQLAAFWGSLDAVKDLDRRSDLISKYGEEATLNANLLMTALNKHGIKGPFG